MEKPLAKHLEKKLGAFEKAHLNLFHVGKATPLESLDVEEAHKDPEYKKRFHNSPLWDYYLKLYKSHERQCFYLEVHRAGPEQVEKMVKKAEWLRKRIKVDKAMPASETNLVFWVAAGSVSILAGSIEAKQLAERQIYILPKSEALVDHWA